MDVVIIRRASEQRQTLGNLMVYDEVDRVFECSTLELPWKGNQKFISCIPEGTYWAEKHLSPKHGMCFWIKDVPDRSEILIHVGNYNEDTLGCVLAGRYIADINHDGTRDITSSARTIKNLLSILPDKFKIMIVNTYI